MDGVMVAGVTIEMDAAKLRELADRLQYSQTSGERMVATADAVVELRRLADGFDALRGAARQERAAAAAALGGLATAMFGREGYECGCDSCRLARGERVEDGKQGLNS